MTNLSTRYLDDDTDLYQCVASAFDKSEPVQQQKHTGHPAEGEVLTLSWSRIKLIKEAPGAALMFPPLLLGGRGNLDPSEWAPMVDAIRRESSWLQMGQINDLPGYAEWNQTGVQEAVGRGTRACPLCKGGDGTYLLHKGKDTGLVFRIGPCKCPCYAINSFWTQWGNEVLVPKRFRGVRLATIKPFADLKLPLERQQAIIDKIRSAPADSYFLVGRPCTGKTHLATALYREALNHWVRQEYLQRDLQAAVWRVRTTTVLDQITAWAFRGNSDDDVPCPTVTADKIRAAIAKGYRPCLYLDEIDKFAPTPTKLARLIELVDVVHEAEGQLVATSNASMSDLAGKWGGDYAETILRRIGDGPAALTINFR